MNKEARIWYLFNSGFAVETQKYFIIFDYYMDTPARQPRTMDTGVICPEEIPNKKVLVFSSHSHSDHFNPIILNWRSKIKDIKYILSSDISAPTAGDTVFVSPGNHYDVDDIGIDVFDSTDIGVSFFVHIDGITIFHSGDLNWWHWKGENEKYNKDMASAYKKQINMLKGKHIDIVFIPVDPRLEEFYTLGLDYFMTTVGAQRVFPMHFGNNYAMFEALKRDIASKEYISKVVDITHRGQSFTYTPDEFN
ncbi:MBL fold metallo-hydrolase [Petroclostridium sp. X23]|uniref:MBL fold metallo-hydrolase n=1 Tax=Petroclostridium sp. X23 TaxID=3045146 RepID=UPI0024AD3291|nr:MBL fold metallo-hydrolase [Petroclostridium sp. X23]WHH61075.1 MBL fold metallo-hydrolase [Petroclostridium sp. X23]